MAGDPGAPAADRGRIGGGALAGIRIVEARTPAERRQAFTIRRAVFVDEQGVSEALEFDGRDDEARHLLALRDGKAVGALRLRWLEGGRVAKIERVAVLPDARGCKIGRSLLEAALNMGRSAGADRASLHAQTAAQGFYAKLGFAAFGAEFLEDGIPHVAMRRSLGAADRHRIP